MFALPKTVVTLDCRPLRFGHACCVDRARWTNIIVACLYLVRKSFVSAIVVL